MKHVKATTRKTAVKPAVVNPYQEKKDFVLGPFCPDGSFNKQ